MPGGVFRQFDNCPLRISKEAKNFPSSDAKERGVVHGETGARSQPYRNGHVDADGQFLIVIVRK